MHRRTPTTRPTRPRPVGTAAVVLAVLGGYVLLETISAHAFAGNSDGATAILEGRSIAHGNVLLHGWILSQDSFWSVDALGYAIADLIVGIHPFLLHAVPAAIATLIVVVSVRLAMESNRDANRAVAAVFVIGALTIPAAALAPTYLAGPYHVGTTLYCLAAFYLCTIRPSPLRYAGAAVLLCAATLGDLQALPLGIIPLGLAGMVAMWRNWSLRPGLDRIGVAAAAGALALLVRKLAELFGTFTLAPARTPATVSQAIGNIGTGLHYFGNLVGVGTGPFGPSRVPVALEITRTIELVTVVAALVAALWSVLAGLVTERATGAPASWAIDDVLLFATAGSLATYAYLATTQTPAEARYLTAMVIYAAILGGRWAARWWGRARGGWKAAAGILFALWGAGLAGSAVELSTAPAPVSTASELVSFLHRHHLDAGLGGYWTASITTVESAGTIRLRPVITGPDGRLVRYARQTDASWYHTEHPRFVAFERDVSVDSITRASARATYGRPEHTYVVGPYFVLVYQRLPEPKGRGYSA